MRVKTFIMILGKLLLHYNRTCENRYKIGGRGYLEALESFSSSCDIFEYIYNAPIEASFKKRRRKVEIYSPFMDYK
ncbi:MAG: hypothetical protein Harvfovirus67_4 [Harvfovirus sp.]|uniref:Uncharacterized protein n=1 Tax=Harvfovirus sp. TaxID=2487768 RepID=A0A3G5A5Q5_9VIRU|nr:MAG: hypothetical protein Harvfovirus67_4 [Harvfovirus sp.]